VDFHPTTPDGRYFVVCGKLRRKSNPDLDPATHHRLVDEQMQRRTTSITTEKPEDLSASRRPIEVSKIAKKHLMAAQRVEEWDDTFQPSPTGDPDRDLLRR